MKINSKRIIDKIIKEWQDKKNLPFRLSSYLHRLLISHSKNPRPSSYPYISGDTFRAMAHHIFDDFCNITPEKVKESDIVFVDIHKIQEFFKAIHPKIKNRYKLITHNGDVAISYDLASFVDDKIIHWYGQNVDVVHPKITVIPIGLENLHYYNSGIISNIRKIQKRKILKVNNFFFGFCIKTNLQERQEAYDVLTKAKNAEKISGWPNAWRYLNVLNGYKFVASPPGNGIDCIRTWEAMCIGVVPIVKKSILTQYYADIGLPVFLIKDWREILDFEEEQLHDIYKKLFPKFKNPAIYFDYWQKKIGKT
jgi:hypothetical protein